SQSDNHTTTSNHQKDSHQGTIALKEVKTKPEDAIKKAQNSYKNQQVTEISFEKSNGVFNSSSVNWEINDCSFAYCCVAALINS
ncbi:hypothetical protein OJ593_11110, partial [Streptococcus anginosus]